MSDFENFDPPPIEGETRKDRVASIIATRGASIFPAEFHSDPPDWRPSLKLHDKKLLELGEEAVRKRLKLGPPRFSTGDEDVT